jgi:hypothetical protein
MRKLSESQKRSYFWSNFFIVNVPDIHEAKVQRFAIL